VSKELSSRARGAGGSTARALQLRQNMASGAYPWRGAGALCEGINYTSAEASDMLDGKHLKIMELEWAPYAIRDSSAPHGWRGFDVDLLDQLSWLLGFTFEMHDPGSPAPGETWDDVLFRAERSSDMIASWWGVTPARLERVLYLPGHVDASSLIVHGWHMARLSLWPSRARRSRRAQCGELIAGMLVQLRFAR
jgi:hypothetical protein